MKRILTLDETKNYLVAWREEKDEDALVFLINNNFGLIGYFAKKYINKGVEYEDLCSAGKEGLFRAINKFDYVNYPIECFTTYACTIIDNQIKGELIGYYKNNNVISFEQSLGQDKHGNVIKIESLIGTNSEQLIESAIDVMKKDAIKEVLSCLTPKEREIILLRYGLSGGKRMKQEEIAELYGCSRQWISAEEKRALVKMRKLQNIEKLQDFINYQI